MMARRVLMSGRSVMGLCTVLMRVMKKRQNVHPLQPVSRAKIIRYSEQL